MATLEEHIFKQLEREGLGVNSILHLINVTDVGRAQLTALINDHDRGFDESFENT